MISKLHLRESLLLTALFLGCGSAPVPDLSGIWNLTESFADERHGISCESVGILDITQASAPAPAPSGPLTPGATFVGGLENSNDCIGLDGPFTYLGTGEISIGTIAVDSRSIEFDTNLNDALCHYDGTFPLFNGITTQMSGTLDCELLQGGVTFNFVGTWQAARAEVNPAA